jgi:hypothetical protein
MNRQSRKTCLLMLLGCICGAALALVAYGGEAEPKWLGPGVASEDGNTIIKKAGGDHEIGALQDIGFFDKNGQQRTIVRGKHKLITYTMSPDGYLLIFGRLAGREGQYLSQYNPSGHLLWEYKLEEGVSANYLAVAPHARRIAVATLTERTMDGYLLYLDQSGCELQKQKVGSDEFVRRVAFLGGEKFVLATTRSEILLFEPESLRCLWRRRSQIGRVRDAVISSDLSKIAIVDGAKVKEHGKTRVMGRIRVIDVESGTMRHEEVLPLELSTLAGDVGYDSGKKAFILRTKAGSHSVSSENEYPTENSSDTGLEEPVPAVPSL